MFWQLSDPFYHRCGPTRLYDLVKVSGRLQYRFSNGIFEIIMQVTTGFVVSKPIMTFRMTIMFEMS